MFIGEINQARYRVDPIHAGSKASQQPYEQHAEVKTEAKQTIAERSSQRFEEELRQIYQAVARQQPLPNEVNQYLIIQNSDRSYNGNPHGHIITRLNDRPRIFDIEV